MGVFSCDFGKIFNVSLNWFEYPVRAHPHHTDYVGIVWHGSYFAWMEEARIECLRSLGIEYSDVVAMGCDMPVIDIAIRYHRAIRMGKAAIVKTRLAAIEGVRIYWDYEIRSPDEQELHAVARVTLVTVDREKGKIIRKLPAALQEIMEKLK